MNNKAISYHISHLLAKAQIDDLSVDESKEIEQWLNENEENKALYEAILEGKRRKERDAYVDALDLDKAWKRIETQTQLKAGRILRLKDWMGRIAVILLFGAILSAVYFMTRKTEVPQLAQQTVIEPGSSKATLKLSNGQIVQLEDADNKSFTEEDGTLIDNKEGELNYASSDNGEMILYNTVRVPIKGEYQMKLADGTQVWLNSDSEIKFPVQFNGENRKVWVKGEVYFDVNHKPDQPFIVEAKGNQVVVLGTQFNIEAYDDQKTMITTLVEGSVRLTNKRKSVVMKPNEQSIAKDDGSEIATKEIDARAYTLWKDGVFYFEEADLKTIMERMRRWYGIDVFYANQTVQNKRFSIELKRYDDFDRVLDILSRTNKLSFEIDDNTVLVKSK